MAANEQEAGPEAENKRPMTLARASWSTTAAVFFVCAVVLLVEGYAGYAIVTLVISVAAGINLL
jgi:membrane protein YdbS with pleckstrin-like domain